MRNANIFIRGPVTLPEPTPSLPCAPLCSPIQLTPSSLPQAVATLGAVVMPYNIYFQSSLVNARPRDTGSDAKKRVLLVYLRLEAFMVLVLAFVINLFVIAVFAQGFYNVPGVTEDDVSAFA